MGILIDIEGIDASGKSSLIIPIAENLRKNNIRTKMIDKKNVCCKNQSLNMYMTYLKKMIWYDDIEPRRFVTDEGWIFLHSLWYILLYNNIIKDMLKENDIVIVDGWFYKIYSRFLLKEDFNLDLLNEIYKSIPKCDKVYLLDLEPMRAWERRKDFKLTEMGGYERKIVNPCAAFVEYQTSVFKILRRISWASGWNIVDINNMNIETIAKNISSDILRTLKTEVHNEPTG